MMKKPKERQEKKYMSNRKFIDQYVYDNGTVETFTGGFPRGNSRPNFDVNIVSSSPSAKKGTQMEIYMNGRKKLTLDGTQVNTLRNVFERHFSN